LIAEGVDKGAMGSWELGMLGSLMVMPALSWSIASSGGALLKKTRCSKKKRRKHRQGPGQQRRLSLDRREGLQTGGK
jgi:hypothetical protein